MKSIYYFIFFSLVSIKASTQHPWMIKDINQTNPSSSTYLAYNTLNDGTNIGTIGLDGSSNGTGYAYGPKDIFVVNNIGIFFGTDGKGNSGIFSTDGTAGGTNFIISLPYSTGTNIPISNILNTGKILYFLFQENYQTFAGVASSLWRTDGTVAGTYKIFTPDANKNFSFTNNNQTNTNSVGTILGNNLYFFSLEAISGNTIKKIYKTDGTIAGTSVFFSQPTNSGTFTYALGASMIAFNNKIYFEYNITNSANGATNYGNEIYSTDGTTTQLLADLTSGSSNSTVSQWININDQYLVIYGVFGGKYQILRLKQGETIPITLLDNSIVGSSSGTNLFLGSTSSFTTSINYTQSFVLGNKLFFKVATTNGKASTYVTNGELSGTFKVGIDESNFAPSYLGLSNAGLLFSHSTSVSVQSKIYKWDGSSANSYKSLSDSLISTDNTSSLIQITQVNDKLLCFGYNNQIYQTDTAGSYCYRIMRNLICTNGRGAILNNEYLTLARGGVGYSAGLELHKLSPNSWSIWTGALSSDWNISANWLSGSVPTNLSDVIVPATKNNLIITANASCNSISIVGANAYDINSGSFKFNNTTITINKPGNLATNDYINNLGFISGNGSLSTGSSSNTQLRIFGCDAYSFNTTNGQPINTDTINVTGSNLDITNINNTYPNYFNLNSIINFKTSNSIIANKSIVSLLKKTIGSDSSRFILDNRLQGISLNYTIPAGKLDTAVAIPIGTRPNSYSPVKITLAISPSTASNFYFTAKVQDSVQKAGLAGIRVDTNVVKKTWSISSGTNGYNSLKLKLGWQVVDEGINFNRNKCTILIYNGGAWKALGGYQVASYENGTYYIEQSLSINNLNHPFIIADSIRAVALIGGNITAPTINITASANGVCAGTGITFTAAVANAGSSPTYQWLKNGTGVGTNSTTYTDNSLANGDVISCNLFSNAGIGVLSGNISSNNIIVSIVTSSAPTITITPNVTTACIGTSITFTAAITNGGTAPSYQWKKNGVNVGTNSSQYSDNTLLTTDTITCILTSNSSCATVASATSNKSAVLINSLPTATITPSGSTGFCVGGFLVLTASSGTSYQWYLNGSARTGSTKQTDTARTAGNYTVVITNANGCAATSAATSITVNTIPSVPIITSKNATVFCQGGVDTLLSSASSGNQWYLNGAAISGATGISYFATTAGNYTLTASNGSCTSAASTPTTITVNALPTIPTISNNRPLSFCTGDSSILTSSANNSNQWYLNGSPITNAIGISYIAKSSGNYSVVTTNNNNCFATSPSITVTVNSIPTSPTITSKNPTTFCQGGVDTLLSSASSGNQWYLNGTAISGAIGTSYLATGAGNYTVVASNGNCSSTASPATVITINQSPATPTITANGSTSICSGSSVTLTSSISSGNQWYLNSSPITGATNSSYIANANGNYTVIVTGSNGCNSIASSATLVTVNALPVKPIISWNSSQLSTASGLSSYQWLLGGTAVPGAINNTYTPTAVGAYTVRVSNTAGCSNLSDPYTLVVTAITPVFISGTSVKVYPNPTSTEAVIAFDQTPLANVQIKLINSNGIVVKSMITKQKINKFSVYDLSKGMYYIEFKNGKQTGAIQLVIQ